jgi:hypothetical protein
MAPPAGVLAVLLRDALLAVADLGGQEGFGCHQHLVLLGRPRLDVSILCL